MITPDLIASHQLSQEEYEKIVSILGREPTYTELGIFSVMWSEHCSYKSSRVHLKKLPTRGKLVVQGPGENAGIIDIGGGYAIAFKIESHNHPSFIEPFQGAATGVGGILRDIFTMGARPIAAMDSLRFGPLDDPENGARNRRILEGVVSGIAHYGNCFGVPTVGGECIFERCYNGNPLVNAFALGVFRKDEIFYGRARGIGNPVIYVGAKTGRDGIHGASMASAEFSEESSQKRPNVQVGDPFMEKLLLEACLEAMQTGAIVGIQDMGAAGLTCSTCEMGSRAGTGIEINLELVPQRETGMTPYEIMLSESQERMLLVAEKGREEEVFRIFKKWGLDAVTIGTVTDDGMLRVKDRGQVVAEIPNRALADEAPVYERPHTTPLRTAPMEAPEFRSRGLAEDLSALLASGDICSKRWIWEQYDYMVQTNTVQGPGGDAAVVRIKDTDISVAMSLDGNGRYTYLSPREGAKLAVAECCRNLAAVGAEPVAATNCLNFGNPERPEIMAQLVEAIEGMADACRHFDTPITGGNVSLYNETLGEAIYPTPVLGVVGLMKTAAPVTIDFKRPGRAVILLGGLGECDAIRFGGTQYAKVVLGSLWGLPPALDMDYEKRVQAAVRQIVAEGIAESAHDLSDGGLAVALAESCFGPAGVGAALELDSDLRPEFLLFHEGPSRVLISTSRPEEALRIAAEHGIEAVQAGTTIEGRLRIINRGETLLDLDIAPLRQAWEGALETRLRG
ncbi:MAG TPA: phosphoribosylformylglycinamidine synthase subunit PurL [Bryobacteraceae bacterium]|nr:phosphoribosylformylglycinamidine synthase subunit PurL [Bryobacteraceae bacterium]HPU71052.1 phosphoribosylformylglycinamidine synthase subunit PurL [Bryobacteraceae bacterium]